MQYVILSWFSIAFQCFGTYVNKVEGIIEWDYGKALVLKMPERDDVIVLAGVANPVLYSSRATIVSWKFDSMSELNQALQLQDRSGKGTPNVDMLNLATVEVSSERPYFDALDKVRTSWSSGNSKLGYLQFVTQNEPLPLVAYLNTSDKLGSLSSASFITIEEFNRRFARKEFNDRLNPPN